MAVSLSKSGNASIGMEPANLNDIIVAFSYSANVRELDLDVDLSIFICGEEGKVRTQEDFVFYNNLSGLDESVKIIEPQNPDQDDEAVQVLLTKIPPNITKLVFVASIDENSYANQTFGRCSNLNLRLISEIAGEELVRYDLSEEFSAATAIILAEIIRNNGEWTFKAVGQGYAGGLKSMCDQFGINI
jgi:tellurium resistance protein TerD